MESIASYKKTEWVALYGILVGFFFSCLMFILSYWTQSQSVFVEAWHFLGGFILWFLILLHARQKRMMHEEEMFEQQVKNGEKTIFQDEEIDEFTARSRFLFFEKWIMPIATAIIGISFIIASIWLFRKSLTNSTSIQNGSLCAAFLAGFAFFSLLIAKYAVGLAREKTWRLLKAGGSYLLMNALAAFACSISVAMTEMEITIVERYLPMVISILIGIIGIEMNLNLILDFYRPRVAEQEVHPPYDSRFLEICTSSKGILKTAAQTLDYQFGFKVSETWFYRFMEKAIAPLILFQLIVLYFLNCIVVVGPKEQAILERFGRPVENAVMDSGLHLKWPWPIEIAYFYPVKSLHKLTIGLHSEDEDSDLKTDKHKHNHGNQKSEAKKAILFSKEHGHGDEGYYITVHVPENSNQTIEGLPINLILIDMFLHYRIANVLEYSHNHSNPKDLLEAIANREITQVLVSTTMPEIFYGNRLEICHNLKSRIQKTCDQEKLGIAIELVGIENVHVPFIVAADFEAELAAMEEMQTKILEAEKYRNEILPMAEANAQKILLEADKYQNERQKITSAEADAFKNYSSTYKKAGQLYLARKYLKLIEENLPSKRVYVMAMPENRKEIDVLNFEDKLSSDLMQLDLNKVENGK